MENLLKLQQKIIPELLEILSVRYNILRNIKYNQPIGRRLLSEKVNISERVVRSETNFLKEQKFIDVNSIGMAITKDGDEVLDGLKHLIRELMGISDLEHELKSALNIKKAIIIPGDVDIDITLFNELGKAAANYIKEILKDNIIISITGGHTVKEVVDNFPKISKFKNIKVFPGRGGMGKETEVQSNTLVEILANKLDATYDLLHVPDNLSHNSFAALLEEETIKNIFCCIENSYILIHGIGNAKVMCDKRNLPQYIKENIEQKGGVGEAYGHYFDIDGNIIYSMSSIGIQEEKVHKIENMIAIAAGVEKSEAIIAVEKNKHNGILITDESTAKAIINILNNV